MSEEPSQDDVCQTCGDIGYKELLLCCSKCQVSKEHRYCLRKIPEVDDEEFKYMCAHCMLTSAKQTSQKRTIQYVTRNRSFPRRKHPRLLENQKNGQVIRTSSVIVNADLQRHESPHLKTSISEPFVKDVLLQPCLDESNNHPNIGNQPAAFGQDLEMCPVPVSSLAEVEAEVQTNSGHLSLQTSDTRSEVQKRCISPSQTSVYKPLVENVLPKAHQVKNIRCPHKGDLPSAVVPNLKTGLVRTNSVAEIETEVQVPAIPPSQTSNAEVKDVLPEANLKESKMGSHCLNGYDDKNPTKNNRRLVLADWDEPEEVVEGQEPPEIPPQTSSTLQVKDVHSEANLNETKMGPHCLNGNDDKKLVGNDRRMVVTDCGKSVEKVKDQEPQTDPIPYAQPIIDPVWRGCFEFSMEKFGTLVAHLSNKACFKVVEAAKLMPKVLCIKSMSRVEAWPKSFYASAPTDENIALYFFPGSESSVKGYDLLVNHIVNRDIALKVFMDNVELLMFSSNQLPLKFRRFSGKYYLWGVFKGRQNLSVHESVDTQVSSTGCPVTLSALGIHRSDSLESLRMSPLSPLNLGGSCASDSSCSPMPQAAAN